MLNPIRYRRINPASPVVAYAVTADSITIAFNSGSAYRYTNRSAGAEHVAQMIRLARLGKGLGTYVAQHFPTGTHAYDRKEPFPG